MNDGRFSSEELASLVALATSELTTPKHWHPEDRSARPHLRHALQKLKAAALARTKKKHAKKANP